MQMCMHEMFFDCPFYEQQMYPGDSRVQYLVATLFGETGRTAVRNAIGLYDADRRENGMMPMNTPMTPKMTTMVAAQYSKLELAPLKLFTSGSILLSKFVVP